MKLATVLLFFVNAGFLLFALSMFGYPIARLLCRLGKGRRLFVVVPLLGIYPLVQISWVWSTFFHGGLHAVLPTAFGVFTAMSAVLLAGKIKSRPSLSWWPLAIFFGLAVVYVMLYHAYFVLPYQTPASLFNYDEPHFAVLSEHLRHGGFADSGNIYGTGLDRYTHDDVVGTFAINLFPATVLGRPVWSTMNATLFCGWFLIANQVFVFARRLFGMRQLPSLVTAIGSVSAPLAFYVLANGYLSQLYGVAMALGGIAVFLSLRSGARWSWLEPLQLGVISASLWSVYPFVVFVMPPLGILIRLACTRPSRWLRHGARALAVSVIAFALSAVLAMGRFFTGFHQAIGQESAEAGWKLPAFSPHEIFGFTSSFDHFASGRWLGALIVTCFVLASAIVLRHRLASRLASAILVVATLSYAVIYLRAGPSYQQWKWAAFITPLMVMSFLVMIFQLTQSITWPITRPIARPITRQRLHGAGLLVITGLTIAFVVNDHRLSSPGLRLTNAASYISPELRALDGDSQLEHLPDVALRIKPWESMWLTSFLPQTKTYHFSFYGYYPVERIAPPSVWMLERNDDATPPSRILERHDLGSTFQLVRRTPAKAEVNVVDHTKSVGPNDPVGWTVELTNRGADNWHSSLDDSHRGVDLVISQIGSTHDFHDRLASMQLPQGSDVPPGESITLHGSTETGLVHDFSLQFDLWSEATGSYEVWTPQSIAEVKTHR